MFLVLVLITCTLMVATASDRSDFLPIELKDCLSNKVLRFDFLGECNGHPDHFHGGLQEYRLVDVKEHLNNSNEKIIIYYFNDGCKGRLSEYQPSFIPMDQADLSVRFERRLDEEETGCQEFVMTPVFVNAFDMTSSESIDTKYSSTLKLKKLDTADISTKHEITTAFPLSFYYGEKYNSTEMKYHERGVFLYPGQCIDFEGAKETSFKSAKIVHAGFYYLMNMKKDYIEYSIALYTYDNCQGDGYTTDVHRQSLFTIERIMEKRGMYDPILSSSRTFGYFLLPWIAKTPAQTPAQTLVPSVFAKENAESSKGFSIVAVGCMVGVVLLVALSMFVYLKRKVPKENEYMPLS